MPTRVLWTLFALVVGTGIAIAQKAPSPTASSEVGAEIKVGLGVEKMAITGEATSFKVAANTKIYAWTKVSGAAESKVAVVFLKGEKEVSRQELSVPRSPYRTNAFRTFRKGDGGEWVVKVLAADGKEMGKAAFSGEVTD